ncbi:MAG: glycosyltransferase family 2 protein [Lepagella sp.]
MVEISVIVVTYNQEDSIARTLDSILSQRLDAEYEIVIGDDASTDATGDICQDYARRFPDKICYLRRPHNLGVVDNYFDCIRRARGNWIADCAGDDVWVDDTKLQSQLDVVREYSDVSMVATDWMCRDSQTGALSRHDNALPPRGVEFYPPDTLLTDIVTQRRMVHLCTALYSRDLIIDFADRHPSLCVDREFACEDLQIILAMAHAGRVVILPQVTLHYSIGHDSVSHRNDPDQMFEYARRVVRQSLMLQRHFKVSGEEVREFNSRKIEYLASLAFRCDRRSNREVVARFIKQYDITPTLKTRIYLWLMSSPFTQRLARKIIDAL